MSFKKPKVLVLMGEGLSGENETAGAFETAGFTSEVLHLNRASGLSLSEYAALALPGGASYGDVCGAGKILALKIQNTFQWDLPAYAQKGGLVLGTGNGFQTLIRLGVFGKDVSVTSNSSGHFKSTWERVVPSGTHCVWLRGAGAMDLPLRGRENRILFGTDRKKEVLAKMNRAGMICLRYEGDPTGSEDRIAGLCDLTGRIFGLMLHPESFVRWISHPEWTLTPGRANSPGQGFIIFENAYKATLEAR